MLIRMIGDRIQNIANMVVRSLDKFSLRTVRILLNLIGEFKENPDQLGIHGLKHFQIVPLSNRRSVLGQRQIMVMTARRRNAPDAISIKSVTA